MFMMFLENGLIWTARYLRYCTLWQGTSSEWMLPEELSRQPGIGLNTVPQR